MAKGSIFSTCVVDDSEIRQLLSKAKDKKIYRQLANEVLQELKEDVAYATHVDTGLMRDSWKVTPLKMRDGGYSVFGELYNDAVNKSDQYYAIYEINRGGSHNAVEQGLELYEMRIEDKLSNLLEGLLR